MPTVRHPRALEDVRGHPPSAVSVNGASYDVADGRVTLPDAAAVDRLAQAYGVDADALRDDAPKLSPGDTVCSCDPDGDACDKCGGKCPTIKTDGDQCGRDRPCPYHDDEGGD